MRNIKWSELSVREQQDQVAMALSREITNAGIAIDNGESGAEARSEKALDALTAWEGEKGGHVHPDAKKKRGEARDLGLDLINRAGGGDDSGEEKSFVDELMTND